MTFRCRPLWEGKSFVTRAPTYFNVYELERDRSAWYTHASGVAHDSRSDAARALDNSPHNKRYRIVVRPKF